ncbi:hypothetical protein [Akkermansia muciniphila]|uniref:hypothetical protein n=1 Tax=Akkermansia muciniphila TaxID=239935 RepID=UPI001F01A26B|nr:hypothetical protein [Akkermansia muciniphila]
MHSLVGHFIEGDLLGVEVAVEDKIPLIKNDKGEEDNDAYKQRQKKGAEILFFLVALPIAIEPKTDGLTEGTGQIETPHFDTVKRRNKRSTRVL